MTPEEIHEAVAFIKTRTSTIPGAGIILGTGLGGLISEMKVELSIDYSEIPHFATATVESHKGKLTIGTIKGKPIIVMQGRFHHYEGHSMKQVTFPVYVMRQLGIKKLLITNISGSLNPDIKAGDLVIIEDHINLHHENPLRGRNYDELGPRFPDMHEPYDKALIAEGEAIAKKEKFRFHRGVYISLPGPQLETPAEYRYLRKIGGDCVGMSTVPEVIAAYHAGIPVFAISVITDEAFPEVPKRITIEEIIAIAMKAEPKMTRIIVGLIEN